MTDTLMQGGSPAGSRALERTLAATLAALGAGALAFLSPPLAVLSLAALAAAALMRGQAMRGRLASLAGPVLAAVITSAFAGVAGAVGAIFLWRLFEETRWSVGEFARLRVLSGLPPRTHWAAAAHVWLTPIYGASLVAFSAPHMIAGLPLDLPHVPAWVPFIAGMLALGASFEWALRQAVDWRLGQLATAPAAHLLAHHVVFLAAFGLGLDVSAGIVAILGWRLAHAAQLRLPQASFTAVP